MKKKFYDRYEGNKWELEVAVNEDGSTDFTISIEEAPRKWRRESVTINAHDIINLISYLSHQVCFEDKK